MLNNLQSYQYNFIKDNPIVRNAGPWGCEVFEHNLEFALENYKKFTILCPQEVFSDIEYLEYLQDIIDNNPDKEIYISCSTTSQFKHSLDPLMNILFWRDTYSRNKIAWESGDISIFDKEYYQNINKTNKFLFTSRKQRKIRDYVFSKLDRISNNNYNNFDGIVRYAKWPEQGNEDKEWENKNKDRFPTLLEVIEEHKKSYVTFVLETDASSCMTQISEKSFLPFLTKSLPIICSTREVNKEIKEMGFFTFNDMFGFGDSLNEKENLDNFTDCINLVNQMKINKIEKYYNDNIDKIEHNYNLITYLLWGNPLFEHQLKKFT